MDEMKPEEARRNSGSSDMDWEREVYEAIGCLGVTALAISHHEKPDWGICSNHRAYELAIAALRRQIPMEPEKIEQNGAEPVFLCGRCKDDLGTYDPSRDYCTACGQHIDWSQERKRRRKVERRWGWLRERFERVE